MFPHNAQRGFPSFELGAVWYVVPLLWVCAALVGWVLLSGWPSLFAGPAPAGEVGVSATQTSAVPYEGSDPSLPAASQVFTGKDRDIIPIIETF